MAWQTAAPTLVESWMWQEEVVGSRADPTQASKSSSATRIAPYLLPSCQGLLPSFPFVFRTVQRPPSWGRVCRHLRGGFAAIFSLCLPSHSHLCQIPAPKKAFLAFWVSLCSRGVCFLIFTIPVPLYLDSTCPACNRDVLE